MSQASDPGNSDAVLTENSESEDRDADDSETGAAVLGLFQGYGLEIEYVLVAEQTLDVVPIAPAVLRELGANAEGVVELGQIAWSNELAAHVIELKSNGPVAQLSDASTRFPDAVRNLNERLRASGARLLPGGMHPWMDPSSEFRLYPVDEGGYYRAFDRIFDCKGHGWSNLQSMHINLPFAGDEEFALLHSAIRLLLPIMPALSASSPFTEGRRQPELDHRLFVYRDNAARVPSVSGLVVPEHSESRGSYERDLLGKIYDELKPHDPEGLLRYEWVNARGCIARFDRNAVEIRVLDAQECPRADLAVATAVCEVLRAQCGNLRLLEQSRNWSEQRLAGLLWNVAREGDQCQIDDAEYLALWGLSSASPVMASELWSHLLDGCDAPDVLSDSLRLVERGCLARRILAATGERPEPVTLHRVYERLCECLDANEMFEP